MIIKVERKSWLTFELFKKYSFVKEYKTTVMPNGRRKYRIAFDGERINYWAENENEVLRVAYNDLVLNKWNNR